MKRPAASAQRRSPALSVLCAVIFRPSTPLDPRLEREERVERGRAPVRDVEAARHAGAAGQRLREAQHLVERRGDVAAVEAVRRPFVRGAEDRLAVDAAVLLAQVDRRRERVRAADRAGCSRSGPARSRAHLGGSGSAPLSRIWASALSAMPSYRLRRGWVERCSAYCSRRVAASRSSASGASLAIRRSITRRIAPASLRRSAHTPVTGCSIAIQRIFAKGFGFGGLVGHGFGFLRGQRGRRYRGAL